MSRSDEDSAAFADATASALPGLIALGAIVGSSGVDYFRDVRVAIEQLFGRGGLETALRDPAVLREKVAQCGVPLDASERLEVYVAVKNLAHRGSRAWPPEGGYRGVAPTPEALIAIFR